MRRNRNGISMVILAGIVANLPTKKLMGVASTVPADQVQFMLH